MWPESSSVNTVNLAKKLLQFRRYRLFPRGLLFGAPCTVTQQQIMHANPEENVAMVDDLVLCQEDQPQSTNSSFSTTISTVCCHMDYFFHRDLGLKRPILKIRLKQFIMQDSFSKQLLNDVIFI